MQANNNLIASVENTCNYCAYSIEGAADLEQFIVNLLDGLVGFIVNEPGFFCVYQQERNQWQIKDDIKLKHRHSGSRRLWKNVFGKMYE